MQKLVILSLAILFSTAFALPAEVLGSGTNGRPWLVGQNETGGDAGKKKLGTGKQSVELFKDGDHHLSFSYNNFDYEGLDLAGTIIFNGRVFAADAPDLDYDVYDFVYQYDALDLGSFLPGLSVGVIGQMKMMDGKPRFPSPHHKNRDNFNTSLPMLGLDLKLDILGDFLKGRVRATGMGYGKGDIFDSQAELSIKPSPGLDIHGGYRYFFIDIETDDAVLDYGGSGPYMGITLSF